MTFFIYLLFFLKFFDLVEDFCGLAYDLAVDAGACDSSDDDSDACSAVEADR